MVVTGLKWIFSFFLQLVKATHNNTKKGKNFFILVNLVSQRYKENTLYFYLNENLSTMKKITICLFAIAFSCSIFAQKCILFIGDSITDGKWGFECDGTRNTEDMNHIFGHGYMYLLASQFMAEYPNLQLHLFNRGISGNSIDDLAARWQKDALDLEPDLLSVLVGINDILNHDLRPDTIAFEQKYRELLTQSRAQNPSLRIVLGEPFCEQGFRLDSDGVGRTYCEALSRAVQRIAKDFDATFVPYQSMFDELCKSGNITYWIWDGVHPTPAGHYKMAELWQKCVGKKFLQER